MKGVLLMSSKRRKRKPTIRLINREGHFIKYIQALTKFSISLTELSVISHQNKCLRCKHTFEKRKDFEIGGIVSKKSNQGIVLGEKSPLNLRRIERMKNFYDR
jgi:hypothetical protein